MESMIFETNKGNLMIRGEVFSDSFSEKKPAVILSHGFMANADMCRVYANELASIGYVTFIYDFCGGGLVVKSDGEKTDMSVLTEMDDLQTVINYAKTLEYVDSANISLLGCSQGGFVSAMVAAKLKDEIKSLILLYPALCIPDDARKGSMGGAKFDPCNVPDVLQCGPMPVGKCYVDAVIDMDPYEEIKGYNGRVLLIHGTIDRVVNIEYSRKAKDVYNNCMYIEIENADHVFFNEHDKMAIECIKDFM